MKRTLHVINQNEDIVSLIDSSLHALFGSGTCPTFSADQAAPQVCKKELAAPQVCKKMFRSSAIFIYITLYI